MNEQKTELPIDMHNTVISTTEMQMLETLRRVKTVRKRKQMHDYVEECVQLRVKLHESECATNRMIDALNEQTKLLNAQTRINDDIKRMIAYPSIRFALGLLVSAIGQKVMGVK